MCSESYQIYTDPKQSTIAMQFLPITTYMYRGKITDTNFLRIYWFKQLKNKCWDKKQTINIFNPKSKWIYIICLKNSTNCSTCIKMYNVHIKNKNFYILQYFCINQNCCICLKYCKMLLRYLCKTNFLLCFYLYLPTLWTILEFFTLS